MFGLSETAFIKGKWRKKPVPVLHVHTSTYRGRGLEYISVNIPVDDVIKAIAKDPALRMRLLGQMLIEEAKATDEAKKVA